jgi:ABC-type sulfate transport system permease component
MPDTVKALSTSFMQIHRELEEAAWVCGKGMLGTIRTIVLPLARPGVIASMTLLFVLAIRELGSSLFLYTSNTMVMSVLLLDYYEGGNLGRPPPSASCKPFCSAFSSAAPTGCRAARRRAVSPEPDNKTNGRIGYDEGYSPTLPQSPASPVLR